MEMMPNSYAFLAIKKTPKPRKAASKRMAVGAKVTYCGREGVVTEKKDHGWWEVEITVDGKKFRTSGDRKLFTVL